MCNGKSTHVVDSRLATDGMTVRRRRECEKPRCGFRFSTVEEVELLDVSVIKRDGERESYSREKLAAGLKKSLEKRPHTEAMFRTLVQNIERDIQKRRGGEVTSREIGEMVMQRLQAFDHVAYVRFASVYYSFDDVKKFEEALRKLGKKSKRR